MHPLGKEGGEGGSELAERREDLVESPVSGHLVSIITAPLALQKRRLEQRMYQFVSPSTKASMLCVARAIWFVDSASVTASMVPVRLLSTHRSRRTLLERGRVARSGRKTVDAGVDGEEGPCVEQRQEVALEAVADHASEKREGCVTPDR